MMFDATLRSTMRTTLAIDDDVLSAAKELAAMENKSVGEVISSLVRRALSPAESKLKTRNGVPLLKVKKGAPKVTSELVHQLREELP
jgi:predicted CopG family antitoxin